MAGKRWDLVFNVAEGLRGRSRETQVPALCELFDQPYTFSDPVTCGITLDKSIAKRVVRDAGLPTPGFMVVRSPADVESVPPNGGQQPSVHEWLLEKNRWYNNQSRPRANGPEAWISIPRELTKYNTFPGEVQIITEI